jgi:undecaprenyl-diphosphatase
VNYLLSVLFGVVEGLTEFLPVSSTAHLRAVESFCQIDPKDEFWKMYTVVIQLGAIVAVMLYFRGRIIKFIKTFPKGERGDRTIFNHPLTLVFVAFVVTAGPALLLKKVIHANLENFHVMALSLMIGGVVMWIVDALFTKPRITHVEEMNLAQSIWIGAVQILSAAFPGTSRSMCTIAAGQTAGMSRASALEFSFFLSIPIMVAATLKELKDSIRPSVDPITKMRPPAVHVSQEQWIILAIGTVVSFLVAWAVIAWFMHWVQKRGFVPFAIYRLVAGALLMAYALSLPAELRANTSTGTAPATQTSSATTPGVTAASSTASAPAAAASSSEPATVPASTPATAPATGQ